jgi:hypothetical protein
MPACSSPTSSSKGNASACLEGALGWGEEKGSVEKGVAAAGFYSRAGCRGGGFGQPEDERAVPSANGGTRGDVGAVLEGDARVLASAGGAEGAGTRRV